MFMDILLSLLGATIIVGLIAAIALWAAKTFIGKVFVIALCGFILLAAASGVLAEEAVISVKGTKPVIVDGKLQLRVYFDYQDKELSWYEEVKEDYFDTTCQYHVVIENSVEVIDAEKEVSICLSTSVIS